MMYIKVLKIHVLSPGFYDVRQLVIKNSLDKSMNIIYCKYPFGKCFKLLVTIKLALVFIAAAKTWRSLTMEIGFPRTSISINS